MKKRPNEFAMRSALHPDSKYLLYWERKDYQGMLEREHPQHDFSLLNDVQLMDIYDADEREEALGEYFG